jgi:ABC-type sugar transport system ATPase subunit
MQEVLLRATGICKTFGAIQALKHVDFDLRKGEIHGLVGENGAGKSTLIKILSGAYRPDEGEIKFGDECVQWDTPMECRRRGIETVYQELSLVPMLTVGENIYLDRASRGRIFKKVDRKQMFADARQILDRWGVGIRPTDRVEALTMGKRQLVEIGRALSANALVIILDEPTSSLTSREAAELFKVCRLLREEGVGIIFISHRMEEVLQISDRVTVFRDGEKVVTKDASALGPREIVQYIVGRDLGQLFPKEVVPLGDVVIEVRNLTGKGFRDVSFTLRRGEILGISGLVGAGRTDVVRCLFGLTKKISGEILLNNQPYEPKSPRDALNHRLALLPEDRRQEGLFPYLSLIKNIITINIGEVCRKGFFSKDMIRKKAEPLIERLQVATYDPYTQAVSQLSGGNQQKVIFARLLGSRPQVLMVDEPTRGVDVNSKAEIHRIIGEYVKGGNSCIMVSSELPEIMGMSDRIMVMHEGRITGMFDRAEATEQRILECAMGLG